MRCPKCKFISFDDLSNCAKCANDLSALSVELNGTCKETHLDFFLGPVIQNQNFEEKEFSESQDLPPINQDDMNFDDTSSGGMAAFAQQATHAQDIDFDDTVAADREDDISIELGDIMPIDLEQLDLTSVMSEESSESAVDETKQDDVVATTSIPDDDIDLNLSDEFAKENLELELNESFSDIDLEDTVLAGGDDTTIIQAPDPDAAEEEMLAIDSEEISTDDLDSQFDLDDELIAELSETTSDLNVTTNLSESTGENEPLKFSSTGDFSTGEETLDIDDSLISELAEEEQELSSLDFSDIDVSDLVTSPDAQVDSEVDELSDDSADQVDAPADQSQGEVDDSQQADSSIGTASDNEDADFTEIDELELGSLDESELATLDDTTGLNEDNDTLTLDVKTSEGPVQEADKTIATMEFETSGEVLPEAELVFDDEEDNDDEVPPDLPPT